MTSEARLEERGVEVKVEARLVRLAFLVFAFVVLMVVLGLGSAGASIFWSLLKSQETVENFSAESRCRSDAAIVEAAAMDDIVILLTERAEGRTVTPEEFGKAKEALVAAKMARDDILRNGCPDGLESDDP